GEPGTTAADHTGTAGTTGTISLSQDLSQKRGASVLPVPATELGEMSENFDCGAARLSDVQKTLWHFELLHVLSPIGTI
ncbi:hypothetical protein, partial [Sinorhizobium sp. 6-117]|uniref:hypothetical protein n=1 Tax=Sinorhizobium sp. 6-117 TaxID=3049090 RepID=UPI0024C3E3F3